MSVCIIPARGGSKRIPRKNVALFHGRPMIGWSIAAAFASELFAQVVVSTDDPEIAAIARAEGAEVPFTRPAALADDHTPTAPVIAHAIAALGLPEETPVCCLYATAPMVRADDLRAGHARLARAGVQFVMAITSFPFPVQRALRHDPATGHVAMIYPEHRNTRSQDLKEAWHDAGQFYWARARHWTTGELFGPGAVGLPLPRHRVQDIDTPEDWARAEALFALTAP